MRGASSTKKFQRMSLARSIGVALAALGFALLAGCAAKDPAQVEADHQQAKLHFLELLKAGLDNSDKVDVARTFVRCFQKGDEASHYADILATGKKDYVEARTVKNPAGEEHYLEAVTCYEWQMRLPFNPKSPDSTLRVLMVSITGDPPRIRDAYITDSVD
jgi:hypothetical protein